MNKIYLTLLSTAVLLISSCSKESSEWHQTYIFTNPATSGTEIIYADQETDSLFINSTDSWTAITANSSDWILLQRSSFTIPSGYQYSVKNFIYTDANTSGTARSEQIIVTANGQKYYKGIMQVPFINITVPNAEYTTADNVNTVKFSSSVASTATSDSIVFNLRDSTATLTTEDEWITIASNTFKNKKTENPLKCKTIINFAQNASTDPRKATIKIKTKNGVTTNVTITQAGRKAE